MVTLLSDYNNNYSNSNKYDKKQFLVFSQSQETQKTTDIVAMLVSQAKEIIKTLLLRVRQHGRHDVR